MAKKVLMFRLLLVMFLSFLCANCGEQVLPSEENKLVTTKAESLLATVTVANLATLPPVTPAMLNNNSVNSLVPTVTTITDADVPTTAEDFYEVGLANAIQGDIPSAMAGLARAEELGYPTDRIILGRATVYIIIADYETAYNLLDKLRREKPSSDVFNVLATLYIEQDKYQEASQVLAESLRLDSSGANRAVLLKRSLVWRALGQPNEALQDLQEAIRFDSSDYVAYFNAAMVAYDNLNWSQALTYLEHARDRQRNCRDCWFQLGMVYTHLNRHSEAAAAYTEVLQLENFLEPVSLYYRGIAYLDAGSYPQALADLSQVIDQYGMKDPTSLFYRGMAYRLAGQPQAAINDFTEAINRYGAKDDAEFYYQRAYAYLAVGNEKAANTDIDLALSLDAPEDSGE